MALNWKPTRILWKERSTWATPLTSWLGSLIDHAEITSIREQGGLDLHWDDSSWQSVFEDVCTTSFGELSSLLSDALNETSVVVFHGCRVEDASVFNKQGVRLNDPAQLIVRAREIAHLSPYRENLLLSLDSFIGTEDCLNRDTGTLFVSLDDRELTGDCSHYALYGSEWILSALGWGAHSLLREIGVPTILEIDLPTRALSSAMRRALAEQMLQEWIHSSINQPDWVPTVNFGICLRQPILPSQILGHYHPQTLTDVFYQRAVRTTRAITCPGCA